jgi:putative membrane protein
MSLSQLPALNALLNGTSAILILVGYYFIRRREIYRHRACMIAALATSTLFLTSYLIYHYNHPTTLFQGQGWVRSVYYLILFTHVVLAIVIVPLVLITVKRGLGDRRSAHARIAKWTLPLWLYVSVTGVVVYLMLYQLYPSA